MKVIFDSLLELSANKLTNMYNFGCFHK